VPVSQVCDELGIAPSAFYSWQTKLFDNAEQVLSLSRQSKQVTTDQRRIELLEQRLRQREEALAELMSEHVALKKASLA
jgi:transposase-like protein